MVTRRRAHSRLYTARDNSGVVKAAGFNLAGPENGLARARAAVVVGGRKIKAGDLVDLLVFGTRRKRVRRTGSTVALGYNGGLAIRGDNSPGATKINSPLWLEARFKGYSRVVAIIKFIL